MAFTPPNPGRDAPPVTSAFLLHVVSARFVRDHIVTPAGEDLYITLLPPAIKGVIVAQPARWGWSTTPSYTLTLDVFRALLVAVLAREGSFMLREGVMSAEGVLAPAHAYCRLGIAEDDEKTVVLEVAALDLKTPPVAAVHLLVTEPEAAAASPV